LGEDKIMSADIIRPARGTFTQGLPRRRLALNPDYRRNEMLVSIGVVKGANGRSLLEGCASPAEFAVRLGQTVRKFLQQSGQTPLSEMEIAVVLPRLRQDVPAELRDLAVAATKNRRLIYLPDRGNFRVFVSGNQKGNFDQVFSCRGEEMELVPEKMSFLSRQAAVAIPLINFPELRDIYDVDPQPRGDIQVVGLVTVAGPKQFLDEWAQLTPLRHLGIHAGLLYFNRHLTS
jgi:hypothetical protein